MEAASKKVKECFIMQLYSKQPRAWILIGLACFLVMITACTAGTVEKTAEPVSDKPLVWFHGPGNILMQPAEFYGSAEAVRIAETVLAYQSVNGGWPKNYDRIAVIPEEALQAIYQARDKRDDTTFDNGSTHSEVQFLARVYQATGDERYKDAALNGIDFMLEAQFENGGWPQTYPRYSNFVTYNDDVMIDVMTVLHAVAQEDEVFSFVDEARREKAAVAIEKGIDVILQTQIVVDGKLTAWCAQHNLKTLEPQTSRSYEIPSISGSESVGVVQFLMNLENPSPEIVAAIEGAVAWFEKVKLTGIRVDRIEDDSFRYGFDLVAVEDETAPPLWARFYEIDTGKAIFPDRDGTVYESLNDLSYERRTGYNYITDRPATMLYKDYPAWKEARQREALNSMLPYIILAVVACVVVGVALVGFALRRRRRRRMQ
jgi:PelA/Pel-15E family pectate lyase